MKRVFLFFTALAIMFFVTTALAADKVVVIPLNSSGSTDKLWGKGRPGANLRTHAGATGYCTTPSGINFALSFTFAPWEGAAEVCPAGTWVCRVSDLPPSGSCTLQPLTTRSFRGCDGTEGPVTVDQTIMAGFLADAVPSDQMTGSCVSSSTLDTITKCTSCAARAVWCCWK